MLGTARSSLVLWMALLIGSLGSLSWAQALPAKHHSFMVSGWELNALSDSNDLFMGFWAIPRSELSVGNIRRMWFESLPNDEWAVYAYEPVNANAKAAELYTNGMSEQSLMFFYSRERKALSTQGNSGVDGGTEGLVEKGFIAGDPLTETVGALSDPSTMINLLAEVNYPIAPGMSDMLVSGTTGVSVDMNPATKQLLNCLRSTMSPNCGGCVCTEYQHDITYSPWTVTMTDVPDSDQIRCDYTRTVTHTYWQTGLYPDDCTVCTIGLPGDPAEYTETEEYTDFWLERDDCPDSPLMPR